MDASVGSKPLESGAVGIGWAQAGDLSQVPADRATFKRVVAETFPEATHGSIPVQEASFTVSFMKFAMGICLFIPPKLTGWSI